MGRKPKKPCPLLENYTRTKNIDTVRFLKFSREIQGRRSQKEFALACGYSTSGISQLLNGKLKIEPEFAQAIWDSRNSDCPVTEEEYLDALGFTKNSSTEQSDEQLAEHKRRNLENHSIQTSDTARNILQNALLSHKYPVLDTKINYPLKNNLDKKIIIDFSIQTKLPEEQIIEWVVVAESNSIVEAKSLLEILFAALYVKEPNSIITRYSLVTFDRKVFKTMKGVYQDVPVDDYISTILIDNKRLVVADEFIMPRRNAQDNSKSIFT